MKNIWIIPMLMLVACADEPKPQSVTAQPVVSTFLDETLPKEANGAITEALERGVSNKAVKWESGSNRGEVTPFPVTYNDKNLPCREFNHKIMTGSKMETKKGSACRQLNGTWN